ncbi:MAG: hypothetical protein H8E29_11110 [Anaerolineales bacterium]|uniref:phospholipase D n=1 Tax=Candidatus Desulfolinea nitratireducens TaxID=2841698 RepID=A0A8J6NM48_9CHLR|nr:hypothetical protein [Candidatus Desulfolinea nitratireducens]
MATKKKRAKSKKTKKTNSKVTLLLMVVVIVLGGYFLYTGEDPLGLFTDILTEAGESLPESASLIEIEPTLTPAAVSVPVVEVASQGEWWEVYFADPINMTDPENYGGSIEEVIIKKIDAAQKSIHIASFEFNLTPVADALIRAHERGVDVRWVTDDEHGTEADEEPGHGQFEMLEDDGIEIKDDQRGALMHNKFWIFDREIVWTGSTNITENGIFKQDNNVIVVHSPALAEIYEREFDEMWNGEFGPTSTSTVDEQSVIVSGTQLQVLFSSEDDVAEHILPYLEAAQTSIRFLAFSFTHDAMGEAMRNRSDAGVDVMGVFEKTGSSTEYSELGMMYCAGMAARRDENPSFLHHKVIVVDNRIVITGSLNFSDNANESNDENVLIVDNAEIAKLYTQEFDRIWVLSSDPEAGKFECE